MRIIFINIFTFLILIIFSNQSFSKELTIICGFGSEESIYKYIDPIIGTKRIKTRFSGKWYNLEDISKYGDKEVNYISSNIEIYDQGAKWIFSREWKASKDFTLKEPTFKSLIKKGTLLLVHNIYEIDFKFLKKKITSYLTYLDGKNLTYSIDNLNGTHPKKAVVKSFRCIQSN